VTNTIFGRWELAVADDVDIRNESGTNYQYIKTYNFRIKKECRNLG